jgi:hypothetical protein
MNSKLLSLITVSFATSIWLTPDQEVLAHSVEFQSNPVKESEVLVPKANSSQGMNNVSSQTQKGVGADTTSTAIIDTASEKNQAVANNLADRTVWVGNTVGGLVTVLAIAGITLGLLYSRKRTTRSAILLRQIEMLERIWKMESYRHR